MPSGGRSSRAPTRDALLLGHAPDAPTRRESITCEINLPRAGADRKVAGIVAADDEGALYLAHSGRMGGARAGQRKSGFRDFLADGVWRQLDWPDGEETEALIVAPLDSPRLTRLLGRFVDAVRRFKAGEPPARRTGLCVEPALRDSATSACDRRLVDVSLHEELAKRGLFGGARRSLLAARRAAAAAVRPGGRRPARRARAGRRLAVAAPRRAAERAVRPILVAPAALADRDGCPAMRCPSPACATAGAARGRCSTASTTRWRERSPMVMGSHDRDYGSARRCGSATAPSFRRPSCGAAIPMPARCC